MTSPSWFHRLFAFFTASLLVAAPLFSGETAADKEHGFTLALPDGFVAVPDLVGAEPDLIHVFLFEPAEEEALGILLAVEKMRGTIGRERILPEHMGPDFRGRLFTAHWREFELDGFEVPEQAGELRTVTYNVQVPLERAAIQLKLFGPRDREAEMKRLLGEILSGLEGKSNWEQAVPAAQPAPLPFDRNLALAGVIVVLLGGVLALWMISRATPKGTVLAIAAVTYLSGNGIAAIGYREALLVGGALSLLGVVGGVLGIVDLIRGRRALPPAATPAVLLEDED